MALINNATNTQTALGMVRCEIPKCLTVDLDFSTTNPITLDFKQLQDAKQFNQLETLYLQTLSDAITIVCATTRMPLLIPATRCGYYPLIVPLNAPSVTFTSAGTDKLTALFMDYYIAPFQWATA